MICTILLIIKLYLFINFAVCEVGYYETAAAGENTAPTCQACPAGSTTTATPSSDISDCGKTCKHSHSNRLKLVPCFHRKVI